MNEPVERMTMVSYRFLVLAALMAVVLTGCGTAETEPGDGAQPVVGSTPPPATERQTTAAITQPVPTPERTPPSQLERDALLRERVILFDYDSSEVRPADLSIVEAHAGYLLDNPGATVLLEGHADERGSNEYNVALGEQRALSVAKIMQLLGVQNGQLRTVSYGEERPAVEGHDEAAWQQNRRVELRY